MRLYVNGEQVASRAQTGAIATSTNPLQIGGNTFYGQYFAGLIDEVRIYNQALSVAEIQSDMNTPVTPPTPTPTPTPTATPTPNQPQPLYLRARLLQLRLQLPRLRHQLLLLHQPQLLPQHQLHLLRLVWWRRMGSMRGVGQS